MRFRAHDERRGGGDGGGGDVDAALLSGISFPWGSYHFCLINCNRNIDPSGASYHLHDVFMCRGGEWTLATSGVKGFGGLVSQLFGGGTGSFSIAGVNSSRASWHIHG